MGLWCFLSQKDFSIPFWEKIFTKVRYFWKNKQNKHYLNINFGLFIRQLIYDLANL